MEIIFTICFWVVLALFLAAMVLFRRQFFSSEPYTFAPVNFATGVEIGNPQFDFFGAECADESIVFQMRIDANQTNQIRVLIAVGNKSDKPLTVNPQTFVLRSKSGNQSYAPIAVDEIKDNENHALKKTVLAKNEDVGGMIYFSKEVELKNAIICFKLGSQKYEAHCQAAHCF